MAKKRKFAKRQERPHQINEEITASEVRAVSDIDGPLGVLSIRDALAKAKESNLDLVLISPTATPPVCKIIDYGKFRYEIEKKKKDAKKKQKQIQLKEIRVRPKIDIHDYEFKMKNLKKFIEHGDKVKVTLMFRGRELAHPEIGFEVLERIKEDTKDYAKVERTGKLEGRRAIMIVSPV